MDKYRHVGCAQSGQTEGQPWLGQRHVFLFNREKTQLKGAESRGPFLRKKQSERSVFIREQALASFPALPVSQEKILGSSSAETRSAPAGFSTAQLSAPGEPDAARLGSMPRVQWDQRNYL